MQMKCSRKYFFLLQAVLLWSLSLSSQHAENVKGEPVDPEYLLRLADSLSETGQNQEAFTYAQRAAKIFHQSNLWQKYWESNLLLAEISDYLSGPAQRLVYINEVLQRKHGQPQPPSDMLGLAYRFKSEIFIRWEQYDSARYYISKSKAFLGQSESRQDYAFAYVVSAVVEYRSFAFDAMQTELDTALIIADTYLEPTDDVYPVTYQLFGALYEATGEYDQAINTANKALDNFQKIRMWNMSDSMFVEGLFHNLGVIYFNKGDYDQAILYLQSALNLGEKLPRDDLQRDAATYLSMGMAWVEKAKFRKSVDFFYKAINNALQENAEKTLISAYQGICFAFKEQKIQDSVSKYLAVLRSFGHIADYPKKDVTYRQIGLFLREEGNYQAAIDTFSLALEIVQERHGKSHPEVTACYNYIAETYMLQGAPDLAIQTYQKVLDSYGMKDKEKSGFSNPEHTILSRDPQMQNVVEGKAKALYSLYLKNKKRQYLDAAFSTFSLAIDLTDALRLGFKAKGSKLQLMREELSVYEGGIATAIELHRLSGDKKYLKKAFDFAEKSKSVLLLEEVKSSGAKSLAGVPENLLQHEKQLKIDLAFYESELQKAEKAKDNNRIKLYQSYLFNLTRSFDSLKTALEKQFPLYYKLSYNTQTTSVEDIQQKLLGADISMIEYVEGDTTIYAFLITADDIFAHILPKNQVFDSLMTAFQEGLTNYQLIVQRPQKSWQLYAPAAYELYHLLIEAVLPDLPADIKRLVVVPDGNLGYIPFEALLTQPPLAQNMSFLDLPYLILEYTISYGYSASLLAESLEHPPNLRRKGECLAMAPVYHDNGGLAGEDAERGIRSLLGPLPYAKEEVAQIAQYFDGKFLMNEAAVKESFLKYAGSYAIIHLAMHGIIDHEQPLQSKLAFVNTGSEEDTYLYAYELLGQSLFADLVVLSACESGYGRLDRGEGIMSLARNFIHAGASGVVMSLWKVSDKASAGIMGHFYQALSTHATVDQALKQAKLRYLDDADDLTAHPFYWADFIGIGQQSITASKWTAYWIGAGIILLMLAGISIFIMRKN